MTHDIISGLVVLEGLDGSGTTTQMELLAARFDRLGRAHRATCEPTSGPIGSLIRRVLRREIEVDPRSLALLFAADRTDHLYGDREGMVASAANGAVVICDRYLFSSLAYQSPACGFDFVLALNERFPLPEFLVYVDVPAEECRRRMAARAGVELFEMPDLQPDIQRFYERGIEHFAGRGMRFARIDGTGSPESVHEKIWNFVRPQPIEEV